MSDKSKDDLPFPTSENHDKTPAKPAIPAPKKPSETELDHGIEESFPASDPVSVNVTKVSDKQVSDKQVSDKQASDENAGNK